jgi:nucleoside-diphosphate-sugar epimerase
MADLCKPESWPENLFTGVDTVFHLAAIAHNKQDPALYQAVNVDALQTFSAAAVKAGVSGFIYVSSTKAMAEPRDVRVDESFAEKPDEAYGLSKRQAEDVLLSLDGIQHLAIVRPCLIYGEGMQGNLDSMLKGIDKGFFPPIPETGQTRSMVSARDVCRALLLTATDTRANGQIYLLTDNVDYSVRNIYQSMRSALGLKATSLAIPAFIFDLIGKTGDVFEKLLGKFPVTSDKIDKLLGPANYSSEKIRTELGWESVDTLDDLLPAMVQAYRQAQS